MARPKLKDSEKLVNAPARVSIGVMAEIEKIAAAREWSISQTVRKLIERGLDSEIRDSSAVSRQVEPSHAASAL
jgi:hypothetical protein